MPLLPLWTFMACSRENFTFTFIMFYEIFPPELPVLGEYCIDRAVRLNPMLYTGV